MKVLGFVFAMILATQTHAKELHGLTFPDSITYQEKTLSLNGLGVRLATMFKVKVYVAGLYTEKAVTSTEELVALKGPKVLEMRFLTSVDKGKLKEAWSDGFKKNLGAKGFDRVKTSIQTLNSYMASMNKGQTMKFSTVGDKTYVTIKDDEKPAIRDAYLAENFFKVFVGPVPPNEELKNGLLGK